MEKGWWQGVGAVCAGVLCQSKPFIMRRWCDNGQEIISRWSLELGQWGYWGKFSGLENSNQEDQEMANGGLISGVTGTQESAEEGNGWQR